MLDPDAFVRRVMGPMEAGQMALEARLREILDIPGQKHDFDIMSDDTTSLKIALSEAKTDTKFAQLMGELGKINARLDGIDRSTSGLRSTVIGTGIGVVAIVVGILAYGQAWFGLGVSTRDVVKSAVTEYVQQHPPQK